MLPCHAVPTLRVCLANPAATQTPLWMALLPCLQLSNRVGVSRMPQTPRTLTQSQSRTASSATIRARQAKNEIPPPGVVPRQCKWNDLLKELQDEFHVTQQFEKSLFSSDYSHHLVIFVDGTDDEKPRLTKLLDRWLDPARQSSKLLASAPAKAFLDSIDPGYAPVLLHGVSQRVRHLRERAEQLAVESNQVARAMGLIEREDLPQLSLDHASEQYRSWLAEARMAGLDAGRSHHLSVLFLQFIRARGELNNRALAPRSFEQQEEFSELAVPNGCTFSVLMTPVLGSGNSFHMGLRGAVIWASNPRLVVS